MDTGLLNLLAYSAQVACIIAAGCALPALLRLEAPGVRFVYWRALVLLCLALPWIQTKRAAEAVAAAGGSVGASLATGAPVRAVNVARAAGPDINWPVVVAAVIAGGILLRLAWMAAGLFYLRRLRSAGFTAPDDRGARELQEALGTHADVRYVPGLTQPVTFGVRRPVVLLPDGLQRHDAEIQRAVLTHELVHVRRRDWAWIVGEEFVRATLWFHPAMWWLISRVQLAREEVVDEMAVTLTGKRRTYVEALLAFADSTPLAPAPAFARRRHLFRRMMLISKEVVMSSKRVVVSCAVMVMVVAAGSWYAVGAFPMQQAAQAATMSSQPGPLEKSAKPITPENPIPRRLQTTDADYPKEAAAIQARATIVMRVTLDSTGRVAEARGTDVRMRSRNPDVTLTTIGDRSVLLGGNRMDASGASTGASTATVVFAAIDAMRRSAAAALRLWSYDPPADAPISFDVTFAFNPDGPTTSTQAAAPLTTPHVSGAGHLSPEWTAEGAVRVGGGVKPPIKIRDAKPVYPEEAQAARVMGVVIIEARIEPDGSVSNARVLRSVQLLLDQAAIDAVMQWKFTPTMIDGKAVPVIMTVTVNFTLK